MSETTSAVSNGATTTQPTRADTGPQPHSVFFISDGTGITAETLGNTLLTQFPDQEFVRATIPFVNSAEYARTVVRHVDALAEQQPTPILFTTVIGDDIREELSQAHATVIDLLGEHTQTLERSLGTQSARSMGRAHGQGDRRRYNERMQAVEFAIEHDDGQSVRQLDQAQVILVAPSRCGKTPTTMYLALQYGVFVANYPIIPEDMDTLELPKPLAGLESRLFGILTSPQRLSEIRSVYASLAQCTHELHFAQEFYRSHGIPYVDSSNRSVEEMSSVILQQVGLEGHRARL